MKRIIFMRILVTFALACLPALAAEPRHVILMIADGAGFNSWTATSMYQGTQGKEFYDADGWVRIAAATHALRTTAEIPVSPSAGAVQLPALVYDPLRAWDPTPVEGSRGAYPFHFAGYRWLRRASDSANTATALVTGRTTYVGAINVDGEGQPIGPTLARLSHDAGLSVGTVTSVTLSHATPAAAAGAHAGSRGEKCRLTWEMLTSSVLDVIVGAGHPDYDNNGVAIEDAGRKEFVDVGGEVIWRALSGEKAIQAGEIVCAGDEKGERVTSAQLETLSRWSLRDAKASIESLARGKTPEKLLIVPQVGSIRFWDGVSDVASNPYPFSVGGSLQASRGSRANPKYTAPFEDPFIESVPTLETLTRVALNALDDDPEGFFLHVEGGGIDWAMHANRMGRMVEEMIDFKNAVRAVIDWVESGPGWDATLLLVTADHDHLLWGPESNVHPFQPLKDNGPGKLPSYRWLSNSHSNLLVPIFARGRGAEALRDHVAGRDPFRGPYIEQADAFHVMRAVAAPVEE